MAYRFFLIYVTVFFTACASQKLTVDSEPSEAVVILKSGEQRRQLGKTPLQVDASSYAGLDYFQLEIEKDGYETEKLILQTRGISSNTKVHTTLKSREKEEKIEDQRNDFVQSLSLRQAQQHRGLASIQNSLNNSEYSKAEIQAKSFVTENPYSSVGWSLLGNAYLLQNKNQLAHDAYKKSLEYDPDNPDIVRIVEYLQQATPQRSR